MRTLKGEDDLWIERAPAALSSNRRDLPALVGDLANGEILRFAPCGHGMQEGACPIALVPGLARVGLDLFSVGDLAAAWDDFRDAFDDAAEALGPLLASIVQAILSFFPGIGTALATALAAGIALARGRPIEEVILTAAAGALPGGPAASVAYTNAIVIGTKIAKGENLGQIAIETVRANLARLPGGSQLQTGFDATLAIARGQAVPDAALALVRANLPGGAPAQRAFDVTVAIAKGQPVDQALIQQARALLPAGLAQTAFDTTIAIAKGAPLSRVALDAARAAALANGGQAALDAFNVTFPLSMGATVDAAALKALRDKTAALGDQALAAFDQSITVATAIGLQNSDFGEASTFMPWAPSVWGSDTGDFDPHQHRQAELAFDFGKKAARAIETGDPVARLLFRDLLTEIAALDPAQWDYFPSIVAHLEANRSDFEKDLQDIPPDLLKDKYSDLWKPGFRGLPDVSEVITRASLGSVPFTIKPPFTGRKDKRRGEADISANFQRAIPGAKARRARISNAIKLFRQVDLLLMGGSTVEQVYAWAHGLGTAGADLYGGENGEITRDQIYARLHQLAKAGKAKDDFEEWHLLDDPTGKVAATWKTEADFLAAKTLPNAAEYRRRAALETSLAYRVLEGTASGKGKDLLDKAAADEKEARRLDAIDFVRLAAASKGVYTSQASEAAKAAAFAEATRITSAVQRAAAAARMGQQYAAEASAQLAASAAIEGAKLREMITASETIARLSARAQITEYYYRLAVASA